MSSINQGQDHPPKRAAANPRLFDETGKLAAPQQTTQDQAQNVQPELPPTEALPPGFILPSRPASPISKPTTSQQRNRLLIVLSSVLLFIIIASGIIFAFRTPGGSSSTLGNCTLANTPCQATIAYLVAYTGGKYDQLYTLTSAASHVRFSDPHILNHNYKNAQDYITNRTKSIIGEAQIYSISDTIDTAIQTSDTTATVPARIVMQSARVGKIVQDISVPLVKENGKWLVDWSPGLIFSKLDDPVNDPNYTRHVALTIPSEPRGTIYDSQGNVLAKDETVYQVGVIPGQITNEANLLNVLSTQLDFTTGQIKARYANQPANAFVSIRTITPMLYQKVNSAINALPGVQVHQIMGRVYPYGQATAAVTGYVAEISQAQVDADTSHYYAQGDLVGQAGVEAWGEQYLRPIKGGDLAIVEVNADGTDGQSVYDIASQPSTPGGDIHTTISINVQLAAMSALAKNVGNHGGSAVALVPTTGNVIAMASTPIYDPNDFSLGFTPNGFTRFNALDHPYLNRAIQSAYPIGSVFKLVTLAAGLSNGVKSTDPFTINGTYQVPGEGFVRHDHGPQCRGTFTAPGAIPPSCDVVFWMIAVMLNSKDPNILPNMAKAFGYGSKTGIIGLPGKDENPGLVPSPQSFQQQGLQWAPGNAADLSIGQGQFQATSLQVAVVTAAMANAGKRMQPILIQSVTPTGGGTLIQFAPKQVGTVPVSADNLTTIQGAMLATIAAANGTAYDKLHTFPFRVAGKTGTAESGQALPHALFTGYAPASPLSGPPVIPQIVTSAILEYRGGGDSYATPVVVSMLQAFFNVS